MTNAPRIRRASAGDAAGLAAFAARAFDETFGPDNRPDDMAAYLAASFSPALQGAELSDGNMVTLLAERDAALVGYAQLRLGAMPVAARLEDGVELARFYVGREWIGRGLAGPLMRRALDAARRAGGRVLWLAVWERNPRAIAFYGKWGFADIGTQHFVLGADVQTDRVMARPLGDEDLIPDTEDDTR